MHNNIPNKNDLEKDLTSNLNNALEDEQEKINFFYDWLKEQRDSVVFPYPGVNQYDVGIDYVDISSLQFKKNANHDAQKEYDKFDAYYSRNNLFVGHCIYGGQHSYFMENPNLKSFTYEKSIDAQWVNVDDMRYDAIIQSWKFPDRYSDVTLARNITMKNKQVISVEVKLDVNDALYSNITDSYLKKALLRNKDKEGIESIIQTIQEKQDDIRLINPSESFIVQGCAGSGKTMVLLHRLRYLLYNRMIEYSNYRLLIPSNDFGFFINDICNQFKIHKENIITVQSYYKDLLNLKIDKNYEKSELIYSNQFLKRIYSKEFMHHAYSLFIKEIESQMYYVIDLCNKSLDELINKLTSDIEKQIIEDQKTAVSMVKDRVKKIRRYLNIKPSNYSDINGIIEEIQAACNNAELKLESINSIKKSDLNEVYEKVMQDSEIIMLEQEIKDLSSQSSKSARSKTQNELKQTSDKKIIIKIKDYINKNKDKYSNLISKYTLVYGKVNLDETKQIIADLQLIYNESQSNIEARKNKIKEIKKDVHSKYSKQIELLNKTIKMAPNLVRDCSVNIANLETSNSKILEYVKYGIDLIASFNTINSIKIKTNDKSTFFKERNDNANIHYYYQKLCGTCRSIIKSEFDINLDSKYKHTSYVLLYCRYLTIGIDKAIVPNIFIDEAQDLSPMEIELIKKINTKKEISNGQIQVVPPTMNLFGDVRQTISDHGISSWESIDFIKDIYLLDENFRNTNQIIDYCNNMFSFKMKPVGVSIEEVMTFEYLENSINRITKLWPDIVYIVKNEYYLKDLSEFFSSKNISKFTAFTVVQAKGLEFKRVCVCDMDMTESEKYIAYTRALVGLAVVHNMPYNKQNHVSSLGTKNKSEKMVDIK
ncbi:MAG: hypothetical protein SPI49_05550 [Eubacteriales bacterium]|nr:hypothetical protein [Eubacteriales bacterium]